MLKRKQVEPDARIFETRMQSHQLSIAKAREENRPIYHVRGPLGQTYDMTPDLVAAKRAAANSHRATILEIRGTGATRI